MQAFYQAELRPDLSGISVDARVAIMNGIAHLCNCDVRFPWKKFHLKFTAPPSIR